MPEIYKEIMETLVDDATNNLHSVAPTFLGTAPLPKDDPNNINFGYVWYQIGDSETIGFDVGHHHRPSQNKIHEEFWRQSKTFLEQCSSKPRPVTSYGGSICGAVNGYMTYVSIEYPEAKIHIAVASQDYQTTVIICEAFKFFILDSVRRYKIKTENAK